MKPKKSFLSLFWQFLQFGCFTFGGGWSIVAQMQKIYVDKEHLITNEDLVDITSVARSLPGTMIGNVAMLFGYHLGGFLGGLACLIGMILPPMLVLIVITMFYSAFRENYWVTAAMSGVRAAVVPILISALYGMLKSSFRYPPCFVMAAVSLVLFVFFHFSSIWLVVIGAVFGLVICEIYERKEIETRGTP